MSADGHQADKTINLGGELEGGELDSLDSRAGNSRGRGLARINLGRERSRSGTLAGSALLMNDAVANAARFTDLTLGEALALASTRPAAYLGEEPLGTLEIDWDPEAGTLRVEAVRDGAT